MNKTTKTTFLLLLLFIPLASAGYCEDEPLPLQNCTLVTPVLSCTAYNYSVYNANGSLNTRGNLSLLNQSIYTLNFYQPVGDYTVLLCDGHTQNIKVGGLNSMYIAIVILTCIVPLIMLYVSSILDKEVLEHNILRFFCYSIAIYWLQVIGHLGVIIAAGSTLETTSLVVFKGATYIFRIYIIYLILFLLWNIMKMTITSIKKPKGG